MSEMGMAYTIQEANNLYKNYGLKSSKEETTKKPKHK
jgi:hypothetical protein